MYPLLYKGKVRDIYQVDDTKLLMVASDRISAFDHVFKEAIPGKGKVLTAMTKFWSDELLKLSPTHLISTESSDFGLEAQDIEEFDLPGRSMLVKKAAMIDMECIVRGYMAGSAWKEYELNGTMHGINLPAGLTKGSKLSQPLFTPSTKNHLGHDENIAPSTAKEMLGEKLFSSVEEICISAYNLATELALQKGIVIADTKFEIGIIDGKPLICDEILTPDSSRFWDLQDYEEGRIGISFDKQPIRDWAEQSGWDKNSSPPPLPQNVIEESMARYIAAYERLSTKSFSEWLKQHCI